MVYVQNRFVCGSSSSFIWKDASLFFDEGTNVLESGKYADALSEFQMTFGVCFEKVGLWEICHLVLAFELSIVRSICDMPFLVLRNEGKRLIRLNNSETLRLLLSDTENA